MENKQNIKSINRINQIDKEIQTLYMSLANLTMINNPDQQQINLITNEIKLLQDKKKKMYAMINNKYNNLQTDLDNTRNYMRNQKFINNVVRKEVNNTRDDLNGLKNIKNNNLRMAQINTYYNDKYKAYTQVMKMVVYFCIPILIIALLMKKNILSFNIGSIIISILIGFFLFFLFFRFIDLLRRDNMNFQEYEWPFNPENVYLNDESDPNDQPQENNEMILSCFGEECCPQGNLNDTIWDNDLKQCVDKENINYKPDNTSTNIDDSNIDDSNIDDTIIDDTNIDDSNIDDKGGCSIIGNSKYDKYCKFGKATYDKICDTKCSANVPNLGNLCCETECCSDNKEPFIAGLLTKNTFDKDDNTIKLQNNNNIMPLNEGLRNITPFKI